MRVLILRHTYVIHAQSLLIKKWTRQANHYKLSTWKNRTEQKKSTKCDSQISFINFFKRASLKVSPSKSCPKEIFKHFYNFTVVSSVGDIPAYNLITPVIDSFNGKIGKFYPNFYKVSGFLA